MTRSLALLGWLGAAGCVFVLVTLPVSSDAQLMASLVVLGAMMLIRQFHADGPWRLVALALGTALVMRYVYWRTTSTLPPPSQLENFIPGVLVYVAEMYSVAMLALSLFVVATPLRPRLAPKLADADWPTVDVFIPTYNEDPHLLVNTIAAAQAMDYPEGLVSIWLLDDGGTEQKRHSNRVLEAIAAEHRHTQLSEICASFGIHYLTRARNEHAKAGNLNNGLSHSTGELVAVFDADHAPARDFLKETVGFFREDPRLFLVQTPHFFLNPDPLERNLETFETMPSENEMFYGIIQRGLDKWDASFFCGSAAVLRREALAENGGFTGISITEDCETALELHGRGWRSIYVDKPLIAGLQPATFASFIGQRSRWAQGMMQILMLRVPLFKRGLSLPQRLCYMSSTLFWLFPFPRMIFLIAPLFYLFFGLEIFTASAGEFLAYTLTYMIANMIMQNYLYGAFRWPWISELYEYIQSVHLLPALISVMRHPLKPTFKVTAKDESVSDARLSELAWPFFLIFGVLLAGVAVTAWRVHAEPATAALTLVVGGWNLLNLVIAGCALGVTAEKGQRRAASRRVKVSRRAELGVGGTWYPATVEDVSVNGARVHAVGVPPLLLEPGMMAEMRFTTHTGWAGALPVAVRNAFSGEGGSALVGCRYMPVSPEHHRLVADLIFANSRQWSDFQEGRRGNPGLVRGSARFLWTASFQTVRGLTYALRLLRPTSDGAAAGEEAR
jgi:cellulose synthase (UDP-forming)